MHFTSECETRTKTQHFDRNTWPRPGLLAKLLKNPGSRKKLRSFVETFSFCYRTRVPAAESQ
jgi:hypothetical protein